MTWHRTSGPALLLGYANFLISFLFNLVIPLVPILPRELGTTAGNASWVVTAFFITGAVASPVAGRLADVVGQRRALLASALLLLIGSLICATAQGLPALLMGRVLQGLSLPLLPLAMSVLQAQAGPNGMARAAGWAAAGLGAGGGLGLLGGGALLDLTGWRGVFWCTVIVALPLTPMVLSLVPRDVKQHGWHLGQLDLAGVAGLVVLLVCLLLPLSKAADWGLAVHTVAPILIAAAYFPVWARGRQRHAHPVVDLSLLAEPASSIAHLTAFVAGFSGFMAFVTTAHVLQDAAHPGPGFGLSLTETGLLMTPATMSFVVTGPLAGRLMTSLGLRTTALTGGIVTCLGAALLPWAMYDMRGLLGTSFVIFLGNGVLMAALPVLVATSTSRRSMSAATGVNAFSRTAGTALASAVFAAAIALLPPGRGTVGTVQMVSVLLVGAVMLGVVRALPAAPTR